MTAKSKLLAGSLFSSAALSIFAVQPAIAQTAPSDTVAVDELVVTGTRLRLQDYELSAPVTSVTREAIQYSGATNLTDFVRAVPALTGSIGLQENSDVSRGHLAGLNLLDLRNLGEERTLVLVNGRRHVAGSGGTGAVDINTIPIALVEQVQVLTTGASAVYGADAVSGVVNFILRDSFEGVDARVQYGAPHAGEGKDAYGSVLFGNNFMDGRGNFTIGFEASKTDPIGVEDRSYSRRGRRAIYVQNPDDLNDDPSVPDLVVLPNVRYPDTSPGGSVITNFNTPDPFGISWQGNGQPWVTGRPTRGFFVIGGSGSLTDEFEDELVAGLERRVFNTTFRFDLNENHRIFAEAKAVNTKTRFTTQPTYDFGYGDLTFFGLHVPLDNPFIPATILNDALTGGPTAAEMLGAPAGVLVLRDNLEMGYTGYDIDRDTYRVAVGMRGDLFAGLEYEMSYVYGRTQETNIYKNARITERWLAAIDAVRDPATGQIVCRSNLDPSALPFDADAFTWRSTFTPGPNSGCVPANIFGPNVSAAARDWINTDLTRESRIGQHVFSAFLRGDTSEFFELPAGPVSFVVGGEYRKETFRYRADPLELQATAQAQAAEAAGVALNYDLTWSGQGTNEDGEYDVKEGFVEVQIPLLRDMPFAQLLSLDGAFRYSEYELSGITRTWNGGVRWKPVQDVTIRATTARAVRAPNISDLFTPQQQTSALLRDPCDADNVNAGSSFRLENCRTALAPFGLDPATFQNTNTGSVQGTTGGNRNLEPEVADTITAGIIYQPRWAPGLSLSIDYYDIELRNAIQLFTAQTIVDKCYDLPQPNDFCPLVTRSNAAGTGRGFIDSFQRVAVNVAQYQTSGYDFSIRYLLNPMDWGLQRDIGTFQFDLVGNKLEELTFIELADADPDIDLGDPDNPEWQVNLDITWRYQNWTVNYGYSWYDKTLAWGVDEPNRFVRDPDYVDNRYYDERSVHDIQVRYDWDDRYAVYAGVNNFMDQRPQYGYVNVPYVTPQGRFFYLGATARLGGL
jgi:iron complex outermembrane recepter protein